MSQQELPEEGDFITLSWDPVNGGDDEHKGRVLEVDPDPDYQADLFIRVDTDSNREIFYYEGPDPDGNREAVVDRHSPFSGETRIGTNAKWERLG